MSSLQQLNKQISLTTVIITFVLMAGLLLPTNVSQLFIEEATAGTGGPVPRYGKVMTRGIVKSEAGNPIWAEIGLDGLVVSDIHEAVGEYENAKAYSTLSYLSIVEAFNNFKNQHKDGIAKGATVLTREEYIQKQFSNIEVPKLNVAQDDPNKTESVPIPKPQLRDSTQTVYVRSQESVIEPRLLPTKGAQRGMILFEAPIDLRAGALRNEFSADTKSLLLNDKGSILAESQYNIGYKTHFFKEGASGAYSEDAIGPVVGAHVDAAIYSLNAATSTDEAGRYNLTVFIIPCPGFIFNHRFNLWAKVFYTNFDPEAPNALGYYYYRTEDSYLCSNLSASLAGSGSLVGQMTRVSLMAIESTMPSYPYANNFYVDLLKFNGVSFLSNDGSAIPFGETAYEYTAPPLDKIKPQQLDLNLDRISDVAVNASDNRYYDVYLDGQTTNADGSAKDADLQRVADVAPDFTDQGLLKSISIADMKETDIYIYRVSNGKIVVKKKGLTDKEIIVSDVGFAYDLTLPGPLDDVSDGLWSSLESKTDFQEASGYSPDMIGRRADFLRPGEEVKIIAINRPTGYIGSVTTTVHTPIDGSYNVQIDNMVMTPPNLKVKVERMFTVEAGLSKNDDKQGKREYLVGFEGGALTTDTAIEISTEWFEHDGTPLPDELEGYTGRLAKVTGQNSINGGDVNTFAIEPGSKLQVLTFAGDILGSEHLYIHVSGYPEWRNPGIGAGDGPLAFRPKNYVPIKAPILDEVATRQLRNFNTYNKQDEVPTALDEVEAVYQWPYRPEMQFSVYDLTIKKITRTNADDSQSETYTSAYPGFATGDKNINFVYDLMQKTFGDDPNTYDGLALLGADKDLIFAFGEHEILATFDEEQNITFDNLESFALLSPEDYLSIRLYQNNDVENILWEFAFEYLDYYAVIDDDILPSAVDGAIEISADETEIDLVAHLIGFPNRTPDSKYEVVMKWKKEGAGTLSKTVDKDSDYAIFKNTLTLPTYTDATAKITANLSLDDGNGSLGAPLNFRVVPGKVSTVTASPRSSGALMYVGGEGQIIIDGIAKDQFGNRVADGTAVTVTTDGAVKLEEQPESTVNGEFSFTVSGTDYSEATQVSVLVGDVVQLVDLNVNPVEIAFNGLPSQINVNGRANFSINVTAGGNAISDYQFDVWAENGRLTESSVTTDSNGQAQLTLIAPPNASTMKIKAMTAMQAPAEAVVTVKVPPVAPKLNHYRAKMVGDATTESTFTYTRWDSNVFNINKEISGSIEVSGSAGESITVNMGDIFAPNRLTQAAYWMNDISSVKDEVGFSNGRLDNVTLSRDTRLSAGTSYELNQTLTASRVKIPDASRVQLNNDISFVVDIKPSASGQVFNLGNGLTLDLQTDNTLRLNAKTDTGTYTSTQTTPLALDQWHQIAGSFSNNTLTLAVGDERIQTPVTGTLNYTAISINYLDKPSEQHELVMGEGYQGLMNSLKWFNLDSEPLTTFANNTETTTVTIDASGKSIVAINSTGNMLSFGSQLPMQSVAIQAGIERQHIELISTATFEAMAAASLSGGLVAGAPEFNLAALNEEATILAQMQSQYSPPSMLQSEALFPQAHAYDISFWDVAGIVGSLIGLDSIEVIWNQLGNMIAGRNVDVVAFSIAILDVLTLFPPAAPLKAVTIPAKTAIKLLRLGNTRAVKYLGGVLKKMYNKAKDRDFTLVYQGIAFFIIAADMALDAEARAGITEIAKMINSTDDFLALLEYFSLADDEIELPDTTTASLLDIDPLQEYAGLKYGLFPQAQAGVTKNIGRAIGKNLKKLKPYLDDLGPGQAAKVFKSFAKTVKEMPEPQRSRFIKQAFNFTLVRAMFVATKRGFSPAKLKDLLLGFNGQRIPPIALMTIMGYLEVELKEGRLFTTNAIGTDKAKNEKVLQSLMLQAVPALGSGKSNNKLITNAQGAAYHLMHTAVLHAAGQKVIGLEVPRDVILFPKRSDLDEGTLIAGKFLRFGRNVDIATGERTGEVWHEVKSWKSRANGDVQTNKPYSITPWKWGTGDRKDDEPVSEKSQGSHSHKQFTLDRVAKTIGVVERKAAPTSLNITITDFNWQFHKFTAKSRAKGSKKGTIIAKSADLDLVKKQFKKAPDAVNTTLLEAHAGSKIAPVHKIREGALGALMSIIQGELQEAIVQEKAEYGYD